MAEALENAKRCRQSALTAIEHAIANINTPDYLNRHQPDSLRRRMKTLIDKMGVLKDEQRTVTGLTADQTGRDALLTEFEDLEERYLDAVAKLEDRIRELAPPAPQPSNATGAQPNTPIFQVSLPETLTNTWGLFNGEKTAWYDWKQKFELAVHKPEKVTKVIKLRLLAAALIDRAADSIRKFDLVEENYDQMWQTLIETYEQPYDVAYEFLQLFFALPKLKNRACAEDFRKMVNMTNELIREMKRAKHPVEHWDTVIVCSLQARLNPATLLEWNKTRGNENYPKVEAMLTFLNQMELNAERNEAGRSNVDYGAANAVGGMHRGSERAYPCSFCKGSHESETCSKYNLSPFHVRKQMVEEARACKNCLKYGHFAFQCFSAKRCDVPYCLQARHHASLCQYKAQHEDTVATARFEDNANDGGYRLKSVVSIPSNNGKPSTYYYTAKDRSGRGRGNNNKRFGSSIDHS